MSYLLGRNFLKLSKRFIVWIISKIIMIIHQYLKMTFYINLIEKFTSCMDFILTL